MSNPNDPSKHLSEFLEPYRALAPVERLVAVAYGVVFPHSLTRAQMGRVLGRAKFRQGRRTIGYETYKASCAAPLEADILFETGNRGRLVSSGRWAPWLTSEAFRQGRLDRIEKAFRDLHPRYWGLSSADATMILRNRAVAGRFDGLSRELGDIDPVEWAWLTLPGGADLLGRLPGRFVDAAFTGCFAELVRTADPPEPILEAYAEGEADRGALAADVALFEVMRGAFDDALAVFAELPGDERESKRGRTGLASVRALVAALRGDDAEAVRRIDEAVACEKAGTRKRNVFPAHGAFALSLLALVRDHSPARAAKLAHLLRVARKLDAEPAFVGLIEVADHIRGGEDLSSHRPFGGADLNILIDGLLSCWTRDFPDRAGGERFATLLRFGAKAARNGYHWLAAESFEVCTRWWRNDGREEIEVRRMIAHLVGDESANPPELGAAMHGELGTRTLASLIRPVAEWEHALRRIEQVAHETRGKAGKRKRAPAAAMRRLAWVIEADDFGRPAPKPREQRGFKNGKWSKGRVISLKRLREQAGKMDFLADRDRAAAGRIVQNTDRWNGLPAYYLPAAGLFELAGHPYVFNAAGDPVEVVRRDPELLVQERDGALLVRVEPHAGAAGRGSYHARPASETRIEVTRFSKGHRKLCDVIPEGGMRLPAEARERVVGAVSALAGEIRVQGLIAGAPDAATQIDGDPRPWVRLEPSGPGLVATLAVEPVPDSGAYFQPGAGGTTTFATVDGRAVQARRDLAAETGAVRELIRACPILSAVGPDLSLSIPEPGDCLELVDQLDAAGARCLWPRGQPFKVVARADTNALRLEVKSAADWFSAAGSLEVDENRVLDLRALFELIDRNPASRFVPVGEGAFVSLTASFRRQLEDLRSLSAPSGKKRLRIHGLSALSLRDFFEGTRLAADEGWSDLRRRFREARSFEPRLPGTLQAELRPYQEDGFRWLARLGRWGAGACLADDMGLGKTVQTLALLLDRAANGPALVVAPTSVVDNWLDEARRFAPTLNVRAYTGPAAARAPRLEGLGPFDVVVTTYGLLHIDAEALTAIGWDTVVLDEAQAIRNPATRRARAARKLRAAFRVVTTGTPIQNNLIDLYSLFAFLNPGMLGSRKRFRENFALPVGRDGDPAARTRLRRLISPFVLRRVKADVLDDLPPRTEVTLHVEMSPEEAALYEALRQRAMADLEALARERGPAGEGVERGRRRLQVLAHLTRLRLACCNPRLVRPDGPPSSKMRTFATTLEELRRGRHKVLVFSQFVRHLKLIEEHLAEAGVPYQYLDGSTPAKVRSKRIAAFQAGEGDVFLISLKAGGVGLNLTAADYVIHMDPWWNPAAEDQASDRAHRIGQTRPVTIYRLVAKDTIEEQIVELHRSKRELADRLLEGADAPARLSAEELLGLLRG
ncbi:MAG: DEAD/DEAH box helicase [Gemmatimonadota bacterium]|nr:DEAD/DEAH box helicase [Gemmatimonadota bacterium]